jgi:CheY-like chemotaxis protein
MAVNFAKLRILIVVDSLVIRDVIKSFYDEYDFELIEAVNGQEGVALARACTPDLILLDIQMPVLNGYETAAILKNDEAVKAIPILVISSWEGGEASERIIGMCDECVRIPFQKADLINATIQCLPSVMS